MQPAKLLHSVVAQLQTEHPQAFLLITGDLNHASLSATLPQLPPGRELLNRDNKTLDLLSANTAGLQLISPPPAGPLRSTTWSICALFTHLWRKGGLFQSGDRDELRRVQRDLKRKIKECKASYRRKMEDHLQQNNAREVWRGLQAISGQDLILGPPPPPQPEHRPAHLQLPLPARPLTTINTSTISGALTIPPPSPPSLQCSSPPPPPSPNLFTPTVDQVRTQLKKKIKAKPGKPRVLTASAPDSSGTVQTSSVRWSATSST
ncbi:hypothetical protein L3Q82_003177 [Scortum barcoo]|uniref:Uncharacterized protein n=1 Tax=Scortum barcoo TaxID=214431 RepID=A0ACB8VR75_9TELE|nr:hypothetical protein L3Q82_003177 [Scortum barcoo]